MSFLHELLLKTPYFGKKLRLLKNCGYEPGHYYSPIPDISDLENRKSQIFNKDITTVSGIQLNREKQFDLLNQFLEFYNEIPYNFHDPEVNNPSFRYKVKGAWYRYSDVIMLYSLLRHFKPKQIIEVGSGYSSAVMLDVNEHFHKNNATMTFIEPDPIRLESLLKSEDKKNHRVLKSIVQDVNIDEFKKLKENDILFIDSSHVVKPGSDLVHIFFNILPVLNKNVIIHFHDVHYPFELPQEWVLKRKWFWNENYFLRAFLTGNRDYEILNFNTYLHKEYFSWFEKNMPDCLIDHHDVGSIWIRKIAD